MITTDTAGSSDKPLEHVVSDPSKTPETHTEEKTIEKSTEHVPAKDVEHEKTTTKAE